MFIFIWIMLLCTLSILSWGFVNPHSPYVQIPVILSFVESFRPWASVLYVVLFSLLFAAYIDMLRQVKQKKLTAQKIFRNICISSVILFFGFPGFSYDVFNYMATAKVVYTWQENPYIVMPIEIPNEPMLAYMQASNKVALYGPIWIALTAIPHYLGFGNPTLTVYVFKFLVVGFYAGIIWLLWRFSGKSLWTVTFFALNPLVLTETILSGHNDVVMMFFALAAFYLLQKKKYLLSLIALICSIWIKYATLLLIPVYVYAFWKQLRTGKPSWNSVWVWSAIAMYTAFILSPIREEIYAWYFIWPLTFVALIPKESMFVWLSYGFTFGLPYRFAPFIYTASWIGLTPLIKKLVTFVPPVVVGGLYALRKNFR